MSLGPVSILSEQIAKLLIDRYPAILHLLTCGMSMRIELKDIIGFVTFAAIGTTMWPYLLAFIQGKSVGGYGNNSVWEKVSIAGMVIGCVVYTVFILTRGERKVD